MRLKDAWERRYSNTTCECTQICSCVGQSAHLKPGGRVKGREGMRFQHRREFAISSHPLAMLSAELTKFGNPVCSWRTSDPTQREAAGRETIDQLWRMVMLRACRTHDHSGRRARAPPAHRRATARDQQGTIRSQSAARSRHLSKFGVRAHGIARGGRRGRQ